MKFATTISRDFDSHFLKRAKVLDLPQPYRYFNYRLVDEFWIFMMVIRAAKEEPFLLLFSSRGRFKPELLAIVFISFWFKDKRPQIALYGEMFQPNSGIQNLLERLVMKQADKAISHYILASQGEIDLFSELWGIDRSKIKVCFEYVRPVSETLQNETNEDYIFAGGSSFRDFDVLLEAARELPTQKFIFCTPHLKCHQNLPANVWVGLVSQDEYSKLIRRAKMVIVPIDLNVRRIVGVLTYLEAMAMQKLVVVTQVVGANEYIVDKESGLLVDGTKEGYIGAIRWALCDSNRDKVALIAANAKKRATEKFSRRNHIDQLFNLIDEMITPKEIEDVQMELSSN